MLEGERRVILTPTRHKMSPYFSVQSPQTHLPPLEPLTLSDGRSLLSRARIPSLERRSCTSQLSTGKPHRQMLHHTTLCHSAESGGISNIAPYSHGLNRRPLLGVPAFPPSRCPPSLILPLHFQGTLLAHCATIHPSS